MKQTRYLLALAPFLLTACGGGGGSSTTGNSYDTGDNAKDVTPQAQVTRNVDDFISDVARTQSSSADANLTGVWIEVAGDIRNTNGVADGSSTNSDTVDTIYQVHYLMDNGNSIDVSDCSTALTLYTFHFDASGNVIWSNFKGDDKPVGTVTNNKQLDFGTTHYTGSKTNSTSDLSYSGDYTSKWIKLNGTLQSTIGKLYGTGISKNVSCANLVTTTGTVDDNYSESFKALFRDDKGDYLATDSSSGDDLPTRSGKTFTLYVEGVKVTFTLY